MNGTQKGLPSIGEANKMLRVLNAERKKYTITVHRKNAEPIEFQSESLVKVQWNDSTRSVWIFQGTGYEPTPVMPWTDDMVILSEENPKP